MNVDEMVDFVISQSNVGTVVKVSGSDEAFGFLSVVNVQKYADEQFVKHIMNRILAEAPEEVAERIQALADVAAPAPIGLLLSERLESVPGVLIPHLHQGVHDEMKWANEDAEEANTELAFNFGYFIIYTTAYKSMTSKARSSKRRKTE